MVAVNVGAKVKQMTWRLALEEHSDWNEETPVQKGGMTLGSQTGVPNHFHLCSSPNTHKSLLMPRKDRKTRHIPLQLPVQFFFFRKHLFVHYLIDTLRENRNPPKLWLIIIFERIFSKMFIAQHNLAPMLPMTSAFYHHFQVYSLLLSCQIACFHNLTGSFLASVPLHLLSPQHEKITSARKSSLIFPWVSKRATLLLCSQSTVSIPLHSSCHTTVRLALPSDDNP